MTYAADDRQALGLRVPSLSAVAFEQFVVNTFAPMQLVVDEFAIRHQETIDAADGSYTFDATIRYELLGLRFLVVVEAKKHRHPIRRAVVQVIHVKAVSVGAHKCVVVATAPFQRGALVYARAHGVALVRVINDSYDYQLRAPITEHRAEEVSQLVGEEWSLTRGGILQRSVMSDDPALVLGLLTSGPNQHDIEP
jgi:hypothetical protein